MVIMPKRQVWVNDRVDLVVVPAVYEIRVQGRLDSDYWSQWFDGMTVAVVDGETVLRGPVADQAALHGLLSRLRDLALPLLSVTLVEVEGQEVAAGGLMAIARGLTATSRGPLRRRVQKWPQRERLAMAKRQTKFNWGFIPIYLLMAGGLIAMTVYLTDDVHMDVALALTMLFILMGGLAYGFSFLHGGGWGWRIPAAIGWISALISLVVFVTDSGLVPVPLALAVLFFLAAGGLAYLFFWRTSEPLEGHPAVEWENLGERSPAERDVPPHGSS
jgi:hypothetical protein